MGFKINISYSKLKHYPRGTINQWFWYCRRYKNVKGIIFRICGVYFNIREKDARDKLIAIMHQRIKQ